MTKHERNKQNVSHGAYSRYCERKAMHYKTTFRVREDGTTCYLFEGKEVDAMTFRSMLPIGLFSKGKDSIKLDPRQRIAD